MDHNSAENPAPSNPTSTTVGPVDLLHAETPSLPDATPADPIATGIPDAAQPFEPSPNVADAYDIHAYDTAVFDTAAFGGDDISPPSNISGSDGSGSGHVWARRAGAVGVVAAVALASGATGAVIAGRANGGSSGLTTASAVTVGSGTSPTETLAKVAAAVQPSVVSITVQSGQTGDEGSGVILRSDGTILTNNHVVEAAANGAGSITVKFNNGKTAPATIVGRDPGTDLAVIKTSGVSGLTPATLADSASLHVGDTVLAIGSPLGLEGSVSSGIVSALHRKVGLGSGQSQSSGQASLSNAIQTDAAVNPGNSGGALVDVQGHVVGINSAIATLGSSSGQSGSIGLGFAIPIDEAKSVADTLIAGGTVAHAVLGVQITDATGNGALINSITAGSGAAASGLQAGDIVTAIAGTPVTDGNSLSAAVRAEKPGNKVIVTYLRAGQTRTATVVLGSSSS